MVLLVIADHASDDGTNAYPSQHTIATKASISVRTAQRAINNLVRQKYIWLDKRAGGSANCREDRRPNLYTINIKVLRGDKMTGGEERGDTSDQNGVTTATDTGRHSRHMNHPLIHPKEPSSEIDKQFDQFWSYYPRKVARKTARIAFEKALQSADWKVLVGAAKIFSESASRDPKFTPHPTTWLNQERWLDDQPAPAIDPADRERQLAEDRRAADKARSEQVARELEETKAKAVPMPDSVKELIQRVKYGQ